MKVSFMKVVFSNEEIGVLPILMFFVGSDGTFIRSGSGCPQFKAAQNLAGYKFPLVSQAFLATMGRESAGDQKRSFPNLIAPFVSPNPN